MILVTGGTGLVGSHLLYSLIINNENVRAIHRKSSDLKAVKKVFSFYTNDAEMLFDKIEWVEADISNVPSLIHAFKDVSYVYHAAAIISFNPKHFSYLKKINIEGTANIVNLCLSNGIKKLCYVSTIATLGKSNNGDLITEENEYNPEDKNSVYAITKYGAEMEVWRGTQEGLDSVIVQPGVIIGSGHWNSASGSIFKSISKGVSFYTTGGIGIVDVRDVIRVMITLMNSPIKNRNYILVAKNIYFKELLSLIAEFLNKKPPDRYISKWKLILFSNLDWLSKKLFNTKRKLLKATIENLYTESFYDATKIKEDLNFTFIPFEKTLERVAKYYLMES